MQGQDRPLLPLKEIIAEHVTHKIDNEKNHYRLEPGGVINPDPSRFCTILAFHKGADAHRQGKNNKESGH